MIVTDSLTKRRPSAAVLTPIGRGAVATIRIDGDLDELDRVVGPLFRAANGRSFAEQKLQQIAFGRWESIPHTVTSETFSPNAIGVGAINWVPTFAPTPMALGLNVKLVTV